MSNSGLRPLSKRRFAGVIIALGMSSIAVYFAIHSSRAFRQYHEWESAEPTHFPADLSRVGSFKGEFINSYDSPHGGSVVLKVVDEPNLAPLLKSLKGKADLIAADGNVVATMDLADPSSYAPPLVDHAAALAFFRNVPVGNYTLSVQITEPAPALANHQQTISAYYLFCGLEELPGYVGVALFTATSLIALIVGSFTFVGLKRHGWKNASPNIVV